MADILSTAETKPGSGTITQVDFEQVIAALEKLPTTPVVYHYISFSEVGVVARAYCRWYNARHPGRRIAWRKLNHSQRRSANQWAMRVMNVGVV